MEATELLFCLISAKNHKETAVLSEVFYELSTAPFRLERERVLADIKQNKACGWFSIAPCIFL